MSALLVAHKQVDGRAVNMIDDPLAETLDVPAIDTHAGWYGDDTLNNLASLSWSVPAGRPLIVSEFGADALVGYRDPTARKFSEDYQAEHHRKTLAMVERIATLRGMSPWVLKDFRSPRREHPVFQNGWNRKGLLSATGQRKRAFQVLADFHSELRAGPCRRPAGRSCRAVGRTEPTPR